MHTRTLATALALILAGAAATFAQDAPPEPGQAKTPKAAVEGVVACVRQGDMKSVAAFVAEPKGSKLALVNGAVMDMQAAARRLIATADAKFGAGTAESIEIRVQKPRDPGQVEVLEVKEEGTKATVRTRSKPAGTASPREESYTLTKVGGYWFFDEPVLFGAPNLLDSAVEIAAALMQAGADYDALAADVEGGRIATKDVLKARYKVVQTNLQKALPVASPWGSEEKKP